MRPGWKTFAAYLLLVAVVVVAACDPVPSESPTPTRSRAPTATVGPGGTATAGPGGTASAGENMAVEPCRQSEALGEPAPGGPVPVEPQVEPREGDPDNVGEEDRVPTPHHPDGETIPVALRHGSSPSAFDPTDPRALAVYGAKAFSDPQPGLIAEPEVALHGQRILVTWNDGAALSSDLGANWQTIDQDEHLIFPREDAGFCCDQLARYIPAYDLWLWVAQYWQTDNGHNRVRLGVAHGDAGFDARAYTFVDFIPHQSGYPDGVWFDRSNLATSDNYVFLSINAYSGPVEGATHHGAVVFRVPIAELAADGPIHPDCLYSPKFIYEQSNGEKVSYYSNSIFPARGANDTMYLATHYDDATLAVWRWPDSAAAPTLNWVRAVKDGKVVSYDGRDQAYPCARRQGGADVEDSNWCSRSDDRVLSGWLANGQLGWAWSAGRDAQNPYPYMFSLAMNPLLLDNCLVGQCVYGVPNLGFDDRAIQYPALVALPDGSVGGVALSGGGTHDLTCEVVVHDGLTNSDPNSDAYWETATAAESNVHPGIYAGDYLGAFPDGGGDQTWSGTCITMRDDGAGVARSTVTVVRFGRLMNKP